MLFLGRNRDGCGPMAANAKLPQIMNIYTYELPQERIAQRPVKPYDAAKLLLVNRATKEISESSKTIRERVNKAREIQLKRYKGIKIFFNSQLKPSLMAIYCKLGEDEKKLLKDAFDKMGFSARAHDRILKVARTIADLDDSEDIKVQHIAEAIQYRSLDRKIWGAGE